MSSETRPDPTNADSASDVDADLAEIAVGRLRSRRARGLVAGGTAAVAVTTLTVLRVLHNVPFDPLDVAGGTLRAVALATAVVVALALAAVSLDAHSPWVRVGGLFAATFGALAAVSTSAALPATIAVPGGAALAVAGALGAPDSYRELRVRVVAAGFVVAIALSLGATTGVAPVGFRALGSQLFLAALALLAVRIRGDPVALVAGAVAFAGVLVASASSPYVAGSALLVGFAVVGGPHLLVALAAGGATATAATGVRSRRPALVFGAVLLAFAGVPATPTAATAVALGALLACADRDALAVVAAASTDCGPERPGDGIADATEVTDGGA